MFIPQVQGLLSWLVNDHNFVVLPSVCKSYEIGAGDITLYISITPSKLTMITPNCSLMSYFLSASNVWDVNINPLLFRHVWNSFYF
jgi:hypothetical protein